MKRTGLTWKELSKEFENRTRLLMEMYRRKIFGFAEVQDIIHEYSKSTGTGLEEVWFVKVNDNMAKSTPITASCRALRLCSYLYLNLASFHLDKVFQLQCLTRLAGLRQPVAQPAWDERDFAQHSGLR